MLVGDKLGRKVILSWKKSFGMGFVIPHKLRSCSECKKDSLCDICDKLINQRIEFLAKLLEIKRKAPNKFGHMLAWYEEVFKRCYIGSL